ncbi:MAG: site-specific DNA-methyltransferase, partial [Bacteroidales bacterium]|nr:site-specific DNA-methyltransferase [Bacteroidales bacterium]
TFSPLPRPRLYRRAGALCRHIVDFDALKQELSDVIVEGNEERYQFNWPDKRKARLLANTPVRATLRPCKGESVDFNTTQNLYIEGDNLDVLKLLRETYLGKIKMIYIDPPYNTGNDFVYEDDFAMSVEEYSQIGGDYDEQGNRLVQNTESNGRYHTDWLNMIYPRLKVSKDFLSDDGAIFISIDDHEHHNLKEVCNEIFGEKNFVADLIWKSKSGGANDSNFFAVDHEYVLVYAKNINFFTLNADSEAVVTTSYNRRDEKGEYALDRLDKQSIRYSSALDYEIRDPQGNSYYPRHKDPAYPNATWRWSKETVEKNFDQLVFENGNIYTKNYKKDNAIARSLLVDERFGRTRTGKTDCFDLFGVKLFSNPKPVKLLRYFCLLATMKDSIVLDFFSGSATLAQSVMQLNAEDGGNRKFIMVQLPEICDGESDAYKAGYKTICEIGKERIRRAGKKIKEEAGLMTQNLDVGFRVLKLDSSNMKDVYYKPDEASQQSIEDLLSNVKEDRTPMDLLFQVMLETDALLSSKIEERTIEGKRVFAVNDNDLICCFDDDIGDDVVKAIALMKPLYAVFRDSSFKSDDTMVNAEQYFRTYSPDTQYRII